MSRPFAVIVLAAGKGTRMKSGTHKVLHPIAGRPMLLHLLDSVSTLSPVRQVVVVGDKADQVTKALQGTAAATAIQSEQLGTAHAVLQAKAALEGHDGDILILFGDVPLVQPTTMQRLLDILAGPEGPAIAVLGFRPENPGSYGRIIATADGRIERMVEARDATPQELAVTLCNSGLMAISAGKLFPLLEKVSNNNAAGEYYLPDIVMLAAADGQRAAVIEASEGELLGVNSRAELAAAELAFQQQRRAEMMASGVTLIAPETVWFAADTKVGQDCVIEPNVFFGPGVSIGSGCRIRGNSHIEGATIEDDCEIGPFARLRPGTRMEQSAKVGNFVETKNSLLGAGAKANHLTYLGDAEIGARANIGAGTITCNYDGFLKYRTRIGAGAFIGSNSSLVAPVTIGDGAITAAGSTITKDVATDALALTRPEQAERPGWAKRFRQTMQARKDNR